MTKLPYIEELELLFSRVDITKIFHDANEDCSMLINSGITSEVNGIFDTQVAHRIVYESLTKNKTTKESTISLKELLEKKLKITKDENDETRQNMKNNKMFWAQRPLEGRMLKYAAEDVIHLIRIYFQFISSLNNDTIVRIMNESKWSTAYSLINLDIDSSIRHSLSSCKKEITGMLK